jgi:hypothetical protein
VAGVRSLSKTDQAWWAAKILFMAGRLIDFARDPDPIEALNFEKDLQEHKK